MSRDPDPLVGRRLGKDGFLVIQSKLCEGGMGSVYLARDERRNRQLAVKFLHSEALADPDMVTRFKREGQKFAALTHPNLVRIFGLGKEAGRIFIVSEYVDGRNLAQHLKRTGALDGEEALRICTAVALGLEEAHGQGIIHRDLKPENIMLRKDDQSVVVLDFGIAKDLDATTALTAPGIYIGTLGYSAPEQIMGGDIDHRADIFALGVILYELLTGQMAFDGKRTVEIQQATLKEKPVAIKRINSEVVFPLARLIDRMIQKKPRRRIQTMAGVAEEMATIAQAMAAGEEKTGVKELLLGVFGR